MKITKNRSFSILIFAFLLLLQGTKSVVINSCQTPSSDGKSCLTCISNYHLFEGSCYIDILGCLSYNFGNICLQCQNQSILVNNYCCDSQCLKSLAWNSTNATVSTSTTSPGTKIVTSTIQTTNFNSFSYSLAFYSYEIVLNGTFEISQRCVQNNIFNKIYQYVISSYNFSNLSDTMLLVRQSANTSNQIYYCFLTSNSTSYNSYFLKYVLANQSIINISNQTDSKYVYSPASNIGSIPSGAIVNRTNGRTYIYYTGAITSNSSVRAQKIYADCQNAFQLHMKDPYGLKPLYSGGKSTILNTTVNASNVAYIQQFRVCDYSPFVIYSVYFYAWAAGQAIRFQFLQLTQNNVTKVIFNGDYNGPPGATPTYPLPYINDTGAAFLDNWYTNQTPKTIYIANFTAVTPVLVKNQYPNLYNYYSTSLKIVPYNTTSPTLLYAFQPISLLDMGAYLMVDQQKSLLYRYVVFMTDTQYKSVRFPNYTQPFLSSSYVFICPPTDLNYNPITNQTTLSFVNSMFGQSSGTTTSLSNNTQKFLSVDPNYGSVMNLIFNSNTIYANMNLLYFQKQIFDNATVYFIRLNQVQANSSNMIDFIVVSQNNQNPVLFSSYNLASTDNSNDTLTILSLSKTYIPINNTFTLSLISNLSLFFSSLDELQTLWGQLITMLKTQYNLSSQAQINVVYGAAILINKNAIELSFIINSTATLNGSVSFYRVQLIRNINKSVVVLQIKYADSILLAAISSSVTVTLTTVNIVVNQTNTTSLGSTGGSNTTVITTNSSISNTTSNQTNTTINSPSNNTNSSLSNKTNTNSSSANTTNTSSSNTTVTTSFNTTTTNVSPSNTTNTNSINTRNTSSSNTTITIPSNTTNLSPSNTTNTNPLNTTNVNSSNTINISSSNTANISSSNTTNTSSSSTTNTSSPNTNSSSSLNTTNRSLPNTNTANTSLLNNTNNSQLNTTNNILLNTSNQSNATNNNSLNTNNNGSSNVTNTSSSNQTNISPSNTTNVSSSNTTNTSPLNTANASLSNNTNSSLSNAINISTPNTNSSGSSNATNITPILTNNSQPNTSLINSLNWNSLNQLVQNLSFQLTSLLTSSGALIQNGQLVNISYNANQTSLLSPYFQMMNDSQSKILSQFTQLTTNLLSTNLILLQYQTIQDSISVCYIFLFAIRNGNDIFTYRTEYMVWSNKIIFLGDNLHQETVNDTILFNYKSSSNVYFKQLSALPISSSSMLSFVQLMTTLIQAYQVSTTSIQIQLIFYRAFDQASYYKIYYVKNNASTAFAYVLELNYQYQILNVISFTSLTVIGQPSTTSNTSGSSGTQNPPNLGSSSTTNSSINSDPYWIYYNLSMGLINQDTDFNSSAVIYDQSQVAFNFSLKINFGIKFIRQKYWNIYGSGVVMKIYTVNQSSIDYVSYQMIIYTFSTSQSNLNVSYIFKTIINYMEDNQQNPIVEVIKVVIYAQNYTIIPVANQANILNNFINEDTDIAYGYQMMNQTTIQNDPNLGLVLNQVNQTYNQIVYDKFILAVEFLQLKNGGINYKITYQSNSTFKLIKFIVAFDPISQTMKILNRIPYLDNISHQIMTQVDQANSPQLTNTLTYVQKLHQTDLQNIVILEVSKAYLNNSVTSYTIYINSSGNYYESVVQYSGNQSINEISWSQVTQIARDRDYRLDPYQQNVSQYFKPMLTQQIEQSIQIKIATQYLQNMGLLSDSASVINGSKRPYQMSYEYSLLYRNTQIPLSFLNLVVYVQTNLRKVTLKSNETINLSGQFNVLDITSPDGLYIAANLTKNLNAYVQIKAIQYKPFYLGILYQIQALIYSTNIPSNTYTLQIYYSNKSSVYNLLTINVYQPFYLPCGLMSACTSCSSGYFLTGGKCFSMINNCLNYSINNQFNMMSLMTNINFYNFDSVFACSQCQTGYVSIGNGCVNLNSCGQFCELIN